MRYTNFFFVLLIASVAVYETFAGAIAQKVCSFNVFCFISLSLLPKHTHLQRERIERNHFWVFFIVSRYYGNIHWHNEHIFFNITSLLSQPVGNELTILKFVQLRFFWIESFFNSSKILGVSLSLYLIYKIELFNERRTDNN